MVGLKLRDLCNFAGIQGWISDVEIEEMAAELLTEDQYMEQIPEAGDYDVRELARYLGVIRGIALSLAAEPRWEVPSQVLQRAYTELPVIQELSKKLVKFRASDSQASTNYLQLRGEIERWHRDWVESVRIHVKGPDLRLQLRSEEVDRQLKQAGDLLLKAGEAHQVLLDESEKAAHLVAEVSTLASDMAAGKLSTQYARRANKHRRSAMRYLVATLATVTALGVLATCLLLSLDEEPDAAATFARDLSVRVFVLGLGLYLLSFFARNYRVNQHLYVVNDQKAGALDTFLLFSAGLSESASDLVTLELVQAVFASGDTGLVPPTSSSLMSDGGAASLAAVLLSDRSKITSQP